MIITNPYNPSQGLMVISPAGSQKYNERLDSYSQILTSLYVSSYNNNNKYCIDSCWESGNIYYANYDEGHVKKIQYDGTVIATLNLTNPFMVSVIQNSVSMNSTVTYPPQDDRGCWIADKGTGKIIKTDKNLNVLYEYSGMANPICIKADIDGGCLIVEGNRLIQISSTAELIVIKPYTDFNPVVTNFIDLAEDSGGWIWFCANDKLYNLEYDASLGQLVQQFVIDPLGTGDPFSSSSSEAFPEEEEHLGAIDVDRNSPTTQRYLYVTGGNSYKSFVLKYKAGSLDGSKQYYDMGFPYIIKVIQGMGSDSLYLLEDSAKWDTYGYGSSSSSSSSSSTEIRSSSSSSSTEIRSSSSSSSADTIYVCGEGISPDCTGAYNLDGTYNGQQAFTNGIYWIWYDSINFPKKWYISTTKGTIVDSWRRIVSGPIPIAEGSYSPTPGSSYVGNPEVQQTPCDNMSSSSS